MSLADAVSTRSRPALPGRYWHRAMSLWLATYRRTWRTSLVSGFVAPLLYLGSLGFGLGTLVHQGRGVDGVSYAMFVAPGVLAANAMQAAVAETTFPVMDGVKWHRQYHAMLATPLGVVDVLLGHLAFALLRVAIGTVAFLVVGGVLGAFGSWWTIVALPVAVLCGLAHAGPVMAYAVRQWDDNGFNLLLRFIVIPMFLFAGTFFPVSQLPVGLRVVAWATPLWHATQLCRGLSLGTLALWPAVGHLAYLLMWSAVGLRFAVTGYRRRLTS